MAEVVKSSVASKETIPLIACREQSMPDVVSLYLVQSIPQGQGFKIWLDGMVPAGTHVTTT